MDEQGCPRCKTTKYRNPSLKLLVNVCGHSLCENCVDLLFIRGSGACPECNTALRRNNFRVQLFEDSTIEKEVDIRKKILKDFNQRESDFSSLNEYNDYLEMVETLIYNMSNNIDIETTKRQIENYRKDNKEQIMKNRSKVSQDEEYLDMLLDEEIQNTEKRLKETFETEQKEKQLKRKNKELLLDELMSSDLPAQFIMASHKDLIEPTSGVPKAATTQFSTGIKIGHHQDKYLPIPATESAPLYQYTPLLITMLGPKVPTVQELQIHGYLKNIRSATAMELAGGFHDTVGCKRALEDAFCGLYF